MNIFNGMPSQRKMMKWAHQERMAQAMFPQQGIPFPQQSPIIEQSPVSSFGRYRVPFFQKGGRKKKRDAAIKNMIATRNNQQPMELIPAEMNQPQMIIPQAVQQNALTPMQIQPSQAILSQMTASGPQGSNMSVVDYMNSLGRDSSLASRKALGKTYGINNIGTAEGNKRLLTLLQLSNGYKAPTRRQDPAPPVVPDKGLRFPLNFRTFGSPPPSNTSVSAPTPTRTSGSLFDVIRQAKDRLDKANKAAQGMSPNYRGLRKPSDKNYSVVDRDNYQIYDRAWQEFINQSKQNKSPFIPFKVGSRQASIYKKALEDFKESARININNIF